MKLRVLSYNIHKGFDLWGNWTLEDMRRALLDTGADVMMLQEVVGENKKHQKYYAAVNQALVRKTERQFEYLADTVWPHHSYGKNAVFPDSHHGNAILSKYPILSTHNLDISTNTYESRGVLHAKIDLIPAGRPLHLVTTHLNLLEGGRILQSRQLIDWLRKEVPDDEPVILAGDFNDWPESLTALFEEFLGLRECFKTKRGKHARTYPAIFPRLRLDRIYYRGLRLTAAETFSGPPWISLSDHLPLFAEFEIE